MKRLSQSIFNLLPIFIPALLGATVAALFSLVTLEPQKSTAPATTRLITPTPQTTAATPTNFSPTPLVTPTPSTPPTEQPLPATVDMAVPFAIQAPNNKWDAYHEETCEEAAVLMAVYWQRGETMAVIPSADIERQLHEITDWETQTWGYWQDTTAAETTQILTDKYHLQASISDAVSETTIKRALADGHLVLLPTAGQLLGSPYYTPPGPPYHFLVIRGYTKQGTFITNDAGTRQGRGYEFPVDTVLNAIHDWTGNRDTITSGQKRMIIVD